MELTQTLAGGRCCTLWYLLQVNQVPSNVSKFTFLLAVCMLLLQVQMAGIQLVTPPPHRHHCTPLCVVPDLSASFFGLTVCRGQFSHTRPCTNSHFLHGHLLSPQKPWSQLFGFCFRLLDIFVFFFLVSHGPNKVYEYLCV